MITYKKIYTSLDEPTNVIKIIDGVPSGSVHNYIPEQNLGNKEYVSWLNEDNKPIIESGSDLIEIVNNKPQKVFDYDAIVMQRENEQISQQRLSRYQLETDKMFMEANILEGTEKDTAIQTWKDAVNQIKLDLPYKV